MPKRVQETYEEQIGRIRNLIAGTGGCEELSDESRAALVTLFAERNAFIDACYGGRSPSWSASTRIEWLLTNINDLKRGTWGADPEADEECLKHLSELHAELHKLCARAEGTLGEISG